MRPTPLIVAACGAVLLAVAGCSSDAVQGQPTSAPSSASVLPSTATSVLSVANPLNTSKIENDPCAGLTPAQLAPYMGAIRKSDRQNRTNGPMCTWFPVDGHLPGASLFVFPKLGGVTGMYESGMLPYSERAGTVGGYPAKHQAQTRNGPQDGECETLVAVNDQAVIAVYATTTTKSYPYYTTMCTVTDKLVEAAIDNLKAGG